MHFLFFFSGSSSGSSSMAQSFSVDDIQKMRTKLKTSKSYPNDFLRQQNQNRINENNEEGDNSSSGVSSDQEIQANNNGTPETKKTPIMKQEAKPIIQPEPKPVKAAPPPTVVQQNLKPSLVKTQPTSILKQPSNSTHIISSNSHSNHNNSSTTTNIMNEPKKVAAQFNATPVTTRITTSIVAKMMPQVRFVVYFIYFSL